ncbi:MAG: TetR family transcriptional regulator [Solirubrobacterales bacterium]|nr:TetR family transcriptional regulator [Solirubrobacterales bacterium]
MQRRAELLDAAIDLIGTQGLDALTHRAVAAGAGLPPASTSYYFRSKDELVDEALRRATELEIGRLRELRDALGEAAGDPDALVDAVAAWIEEQLHGAGRAACFAQYHLQLEAARRPELRDALVARAAATRALAEEVLERLGAPDPGQAALLLVCAVDGVRLEALASGHDAHLRGPELRALLARLLRSLLRDQA